MQQVVAQNAQAIPRPRHRGGLDGVLELVDLFVEVVDQLEVPLGDVVDEPVEHHARVVDHVDFLVEDAIVCRNDHGDEEDD
ncbi:MAG TPA: hypothetical protein VF025_06805 [Gaiellaceae bacterium]